MAGAVPPRLSEIGITMKRHEAQEAVVNDLKQHVPQRTKVDLLWTEKQRNQTETDDLLAGFLRMAIEYRLRLESFLKPRRDRKQLASRLIWLDKLGKYARHAADCPRDGNPEAECTCGYSAAIAAEPSGPLE